MDGMEASFDKRDRALTRIHLIFTEHFQLSWIPRRGVCSIIVGGYTSTSEAEIYDTKYFLLINVFLDNTGFTVNTFAIDYDDTWKKFSISDSAILHATLSLVAQHEDILRGVKDSINNLFHKGQAMKFINSRLGQDAECVSDGNITSVAILVILEVRL
jgi:hypothetical protein